MGCKVIPFHHVDSETVDALKYLLQEAEAGRVDGFTGVIHHVGPNYSTLIVGKGRLTPTLTRGMVQVLDDEVAALLLPAPQLA